MILDLLVAMMKTIFSLLILILSFSLFSQELFSTKFRIKNEGQNFFKLDAQAASLSNNIIRNNAFLSFISPEEVNQDFKSCWKKFILNRSVKIEIKKSKYKQIAINNEYFIYQTTFNPKDVNIINVSLNQFKNFCKIN